MVVLHGVPEQLLANTPGLQHALRPALGFVCAMASSVLPKMQDALRSRPA
jgi:hypothetical protein